MTREDWESDLSMCCVDHLLCAHRAKPPFFLVYFKVWLKIKSNSEVWGQIQTWVGHWTYAPHFFLAQYRTDGHCFEIDHMHFRLILPSSFWLGIWSYKLDRTLKCETCTQKCFCRFRCQHFSVLLFLVILNVSKLRLGPLALSSKKNFKT